jgi:hypothetical protein
MIKDEYDSFGTTTLCWQLQASLFEVTSKPLTLGLM